MSQKEIKAKYADVKKKLHACSPAEYKGLLQLMNFYYNKLN